MNPLSRTAIKEAQILSLIRRYPDLTYAAIAIRVGTSKRMETIN